MSPFFSICLPVFNGERFLEHAIASVRAQSCADWELLIADNASTDATPQIAARWAAADQRIRWVRRPRNLGLGGNIDACLSETRGRWTGFLAADDVYLPGLLERVRANAMREPDLVLWTHAHTCRHGPERADTVRPFPHVASWTSQRAAQIFFLRGNPFGEISCFLFRSDAAQRIDGGFGRDWPPSDVWFWLRLLRANPRGVMIYSPEILTETRAHAASESARYMREADNWVSVFEFMAVAGEQLAWPLSQRLFQVARAGVCWARHMRKIPLRRQPEVAWFVGRVVAAVFRKCSPS